MLKLYYATGTCSLASHIALAEAGATYEIVALDFKSNAQRRPEYLALNPKGRVPLLMTSRGPLTETPAILAYVAQSFPASRLAPLDDAHAFARMQEFNSYLCSTVHVSHAHGPRASRWADDEAAWASMRRKVSENMRSAFTHIESTWSGGPWVMGDAYTVSDAYLYALSGWLAGDGVDIQEYPSVAAHRERMGERTAVQRALAEEGVGPKAPA
jgi:glutathione S-transferase